MKKLKKKVVENANAHILNNIKLREDMHGRWKRCFVLANIETGKMSVVKATERGAKGELKRKKSDTYYSQHLEKMVSYGEGLEIVKVEEDDLLELNNKQLWYNTLWYDFTNYYPGGIVERYDYYFKEYSVDSEIIEMVVEYSKEMEGEGAFTKQEELHKNLIEAKR